MLDIAIVLIIAAIAAVIGVGFGIVFLAPRIGRMLDRAEPDVSAESVSMEDPNGESPAGG